MMLRLHSHTKNNITMETNENCSKILFVELLCIGIFLISCTQTNNSDIAASQTSSLSTPQNQSPDAVDRVVQESNIETVYADTDGDGIDDRIERCDPAAICIYRIDQEGKESSLHTYHNPDWATVSIEQVEDIDNFPGNEVVVKTTTIGGNFGCVCIITARDHSVTSYGDPSWSFVTIQFLSNTDGDAGQEIILSVANGQGGFHCVCVIHPSRGSYEIYRDTEWKAVTIQSQVDTDGLPGEELVLDVRDGQNRLVCICVIHDRSTTTMAYRSSMWIAREVNSSDNTNGRPDIEILIDDTDGYLGAEIILVFRGPTTAGISVIHDKTKESNVYQFSDVVVELLSDRDTFPGSEICLLVPSSNEHFVIRDRTKGQETIEACA